MRIWSLHPKYLDSKGLVALWRETLLAKHVLEGKTRGYKNHPQLDRFKNVQSPLDAINHYLSVIYLESIERGYQFNESKINQSFKKCSINVTTGQLDFETGHLLKKLKLRDIKKYNEIKSIQPLEVHPLFVVMDGSVEAWELIQRK